MQAQPQPPALMVSQREAVATYVSMTDYDAAQEGQARAACLRSRYGPDTRHAFALGYAQALKDVRAALK